MKVSYVGNFTDGTGWAKAATYNALAINMKHEVHCQEFKYNSNNVLLEQKIEELNVKDGPFDYTIHHVLPTEYVKYANTINVGFLPLESTVSNVKWLKNIKLMDYMAVPDQRSKELLEWSGIKPDSIVIFPHSFNYNKINEYQKSVNIPGIENAFNFIFVGEFNARKNIETLLRAFYTEFSFYDNVNLIIKTNGNHAAIEQFCKDVKNKCRKNGKVRDPIIITGYMSEQDLTSLIKQCQIFVTASHGEAWCYPALESMACGLDVIYPAQTGMADYVDGFQVQSNNTYCYGADDAVPGLYTCKDVWTDINFEHLMSQMRFASSCNWESKVEEQKNKAKQFHYENGLGVERIIK